MIDRLWWDAHEPPWREALLWPLTVASLAYRASFAWRKARVRPRRASAPVISVGNLVVGGAGKTPVVLALAQRLLELGRRPAVLSRGYGRAARKPAEVGAGSRAQDVGDEPLLLKRRIPALRVFVSARRSELADEAVKAGADVLLLDDGLQHHALARDLDVVVVDASNPFGNGRSLPRGPLRERPAALRTLGPGLLWLTRCDLPRDPRLRELRGLRGPVESAFAVVGAPVLRGRRAFLFAGIARPTSFEQTARSAGGQVAGARWFPDHHRFTPRDLALVRREAQAAGAEVLATTEKDFVRIDPMLASGTPPVVSVPVDLRILEGSEALDVALREALA